jgi:hypothetical protein
LARRNSLALVLVLLCAGCALRVARVTPGTAVALDRPLVLNGHPLWLHMHTPDPRTPRPLVVYATGDGGWSGKDLSAYRALVDTGDAVVGFDAHDYVNHLGTGVAATTTPARLARDYQAIITTARDAMHLAAGVPVVLVGVSRGAGLSVVAAGAPALRPEVSGVLAVGLTKEEEYAKWFRRLRVAGERRRRPPVMVELYDYLPRLGTMPIAVIQSTRDNYLPAAAARALFGPDTARRRFIAIEARNHSFSGARGEMYEAMQESLVWIDDAQGR